MSEPTNNANQACDLPRAEEILECLRAAVAEAIETKRKLGQFWVVNTPDGPKFVTE